jgi:hypothetical protein
MMSKIHVKADFTPDLIAVTTSFELGDTHDKIIRQVIHLQDDAVRQALIELGWTPPKQITVQHLPADDSEGGLL